MEQWETICSGSSLVDKLRFSASCEVLLEHTADVAESITVFLTKESLESAWGDVLNQVCVESSSALKSNYKDFAHKILNGYRFISNFIHGLPKKSLAADHVRSLSDISSMREYLMLTVEPLLTVCSKSEFKTLILNERNSFSDFISNLPTNSRVIIIELLCKSSTNKDFQMEGVLANLSSFTTQLTPNLCLDMSTLLIKWCGQIKPLHPSTVPGMKLLLNELLLIIAEKIPASTIVGLLLLRKAVDEETAAIIMNSIHEENLLESIDSVAALWGEKLFVNRGDIKMQLYLASALNTGLLRIAKMQQINPETNILEKSGSRKVPLIITLSTGISSYLDSSDRRSRLSGMKIARFVSELMGHELIFDELEEEEIKNENVEQVQKTVVNVPNLEESDSDSDFEPFDIYEENDSKTVLSANYLRSCLDMLRATEHQSDASEKHRISMENIPRILASKPFDAVDLCGQLTRELIQLSNTYNIEGFDELRDNALQSLIFFYPEYSVPIVTDIISSDQYLLGSRVYAVGALSKAAFLMSGIPSANNQSHVTEHASISIQENKMNEVTKNTVIRRPRKLAAMKKKVKYFRNKFGANVSHLFFYPVMKVILDSQIISVKKKSSNKSMESNDDIEFMLPAEILLALAAFTKCSHNTSRQRSYIEYTMSVVLSHYCSESLMVRRAALMAGSMAIEAWVHQRKTENTGKNDIIPAGALDTLTDLAGHTQFLGNEQPNSQLPSLADGKLGAAVATFVDGALNSLKGDPDPVCRALKVEIAKGALSLDEDYENLQDH